MPKSVKGSTYFLNDQQAEDWANDIPTTVEEKFTTPNGKEKTRTVRKQYEPPSDPVKTIDYKSMVPSLIAAMQQQQKMIKKMSDRIDVLERQLRDKPERTAPRTRGSHPSIKNVLTSAEKSKSKQRSRNK